MLFRSQTRQRIMQELAGVKAQKDTDAAEEKIEATQDQQDQKPLQESEVEKHGETGEQLTIEDGEKQE